MSKKRDNNKTSHLNIAAIVQRLPLHQHMSQSQTALIKLAPFWTQWCKQNLNSELADQTSLTSLQSGELVISCANAVTASQLKHMQTSLFESLQLESLQLSGVAKIKRITIRIDHAHHSNLQQSNEQANTKQTKRLLGSNGPLNNDATEELTQTRRKSLNSFTIKSIESCQKLTSNDELADSLKRLVQTLLKH